MKKRVSRPSPLLHFVILATLATLGPAYYINFVGRGSSLTERYLLYPYVGEGLLVLVMGVVLFSFGWVAALAIPLRRRLNYQRHRHPATTRWPSLLFFCFLVLVLIFLLGPGPNEVQSNIAKLQTKVTGTLEAQSEIYFILSLLVAQAFLIFFDESHGKSRPSLYAWSVCFVAAILAVAVGSRYRGASALLIPIYYLYWTGRAKLITLLITAVAAMPLVSFLSTLRTYAQGVTQESGSGVLETFVAQWSVLDGAIVAAYLREVYPLGIFDAAIRVVEWNLPSFLVGDKDFVATVMARMVLTGDSGSGITLGLFGETYYYFGALVGGLVTVFLGMAVGRIKQFSSLPNLIGAGAFFTLATILIASLRNGFFSDMLTYVAIWVCVGVNIAIQRLSVSRPSRRSRGKQRYRTIDAVSVRSGERGRRSASAPRA